MENNTSFGVIKLELEPDKSNAEICGEHLRLFNHLGTLVLGEANMTNYANDTPSITLCYLSTLKHYYKLAPEDRLSLRRQCEEKSIQNGVDNRMIVVYKNATTTPVKDEKTGKMQVQGGVPLYNDIIGFVCYYESNEKSLLYVSHLYICHAHRRQGICRHILSTVVREATTPRPLLVISEVPLTEAALRLFFACGFDVRGSPSSTLPAQERLALSGELTTLMRRARQCESLVALIDANYYKALVDAEYNTLRMVYLAWQCHWCGEKSDTLSYCTGCRSVLYCSQKCQKEAWRTHKLNCNDKRV
jgi:predicted GNAT family acetyltransferase